MFASFSSWKIARIAGIDLFLHPTFLLVPLMILLRDEGVFGVVFASLLFGSVVLHELGHALMARRYGIATKDITLYPIGGVARLERMPRSAGPELLIALAGPAVNLVIAGIAWPSLQIIAPVVGSVVFFETLELILWINVGLLLFNLLPVFPLDGGRVLRALLTSWLGRLRATEAAAGFGRMFAAVAGIYFLFNGLWMNVFVAGFIYMACVFELWGVRFEEQRRLRAEDWPAPPPGYRWVDGGDGVWRLAPIRLTWGRQPSGRS